LDWIKIVLAGYNRDCKHYNKNLLLCRTNFFILQVLKHQSLPTTKENTMKIQSLFMVSIICLFCTGAFAEQAATAEPGTAVTGLCKDGTAYTGASKKGACRGHKGVKEWYADKAGPAPNAPAAAAPAAKEAAPVSAEGAATGLCKDGTAYTGASKKGACRGHKGIKEWYADTKEKAPVASEAAAAPVAATPAAATTGGVATGLCKDGTEYTGATKRGACRGHKGINEWYADKKAPTAESAAPAAAPAAATIAPAQEAKPAAETPAQVAPAAGSGKVWVNTRSKIYHCEGSKFYGKTKEGEYMSEADAQAKGYAANRKKVCN
jgi:hypothetical protein